MYALKYSYHHEIPRLLEGNPVEGMKLLAKYIHCVTLLRSDEDKKKKNLYISMTPFRRAKDAKNDA